MTDHFVFFGVVIPAVAAIIVALIKTQRKPTIKHSPPTEVEVLQEEIKQLKTQLERQHIKIDDISERLAWLEGKVS